MSVSVFAPAKPSRPPACGRGGAGGREWAPDVGSEVEGEGVVFSVGGAIVAAKNGHPTVRRIALEHALRERRRLGVFAAGAEEEIVDIRERVAPLLQQIACVDARQALEQARAHEELDHRHRAGAVRGGWNRESYEMSEWLRVYDGGLAWGVNDGNDAPSPEARRFALHLRLRRTVRRAASRCLRTMRCND